MEHRLIRLWIGRQTQESAHIKLMERLMAMHCQNGKPAIEPRHGYAWVYTTSLDRLESLMTSCRHNQIDSAGSDSSNVRFKIEKRTFPLVSWSFDADA